VAAVPVAQGTAAHRNKEAIATTLRPPAAHLGRRLPDAGVVTVAGCTVLLGTAGFAAPVKR
jgi:hypothetical protein